MAKYMLALVVTGTVVASSVLVNDGAPPVAPAPVQTIGAVKIFAAGRVEGRSPTMEMRLSLRGRVVEQAVQEGQVVQAGELLLRVEDEQLRHRVALAAAEVRLAEAELDLLNEGARDEEIRVARALVDAKKSELDSAQLEWRRVQGLITRDAVSQQEHDTRRTNADIVEAEVAAAQARLDLLKAPAREDEVAMAVARIEAAKARLKLAEADLEDTQLRAPTTCQILKVNAQIGELTGPDASEPAVVVSDTSLIRVRAFVEEIDAPRVSIGMPAEVTADGLSGTTFQGKITQVSPRMSHKSLWTDDPGERFDTKTREVWLDLDNADGLVVGLRVDVNIDPDSVPGDDSPDSDASPSLTLPELTFSE